MADDSLPPARVDRLRRLGSLLRPHTVAVIGASSQRATLGNAVLRNFDRWPLQGDLFVVHPAAGAIEGRPAVPRVADLPQGLDVAVVCLPAPAVPEVLLALDGIGCQAAVVVAAGLDPDQDRRLREVVSRISVAVCGPNNMGLINATDAVAMYTARFRDPLPVGPVALVAQSGSAAIALVNAPGLAFSKVITSGNELSLTGADYLRWLATDPATAAAGVVLESIRDGADFASAAREFARAGKRLAVLKVGRTPAGSAAAQAHTGALIGTSAAHEAFFRREGIAVARDYDELVATLQCFAAGVPAARGRRLAIVAISGGEGALAADIATEAGLPLAALSDTTRAALSAAMPGAKVDNPVDLHASVARTPDADALALRALLADPGVDIMLALQDAQHTLPIHDAHDYVRYLDTLADAVRGAAKPVVVASTTSTDTHPRLARALAGTSVPLLRGIRDAVAACGNLAPEPGRPPQIPVDRPPAEALPLEETRRLLTAYGIPLVRHAVARDRAAAVRAARDIGYPLVVKAVARRLLHRTEAGGVVLGVASDEALDEALRGLAARVPALEGYELQPLLTGVVEVLVGFKAEPGLGGIVSVGLGGVLVELLPEPTVDLVPVTEEQAAAMIRSSPAGRLLDGYRGIVPPTDVGPLARVVHALSRLGAERGGTVAAVDLNPVMVRHGSGEALVVDALVLGGAP